MGSESAPACALDGRPRILLAPWVFGLTWWLTTLIYFCNGIVASIFTIIYLAGYVVRDGYFVEVTGLLPTRFMPIVIGLYGGFALFFWFSVLRNLVSLCCSRRRHARRRKRAIVPIVRAPTLTKGPNTQQRLRKWWKRLFGSDDGIFSVNGDVFEVLFLSREVTEVVLQTYQAYKCSTLISQPWINHIYVAVLVANCWAAPLIYTLARDNVVRQRFLYLWSDVILDLVSALVIPVIVAVTMIRIVFQNALVQASASANGRPITYLFDVPYDDVLLVNLFKAAQQVCATSWLDLVSKLLPLASMISCLKSIKKLAKPRPRKKTDVQVIGPTLPIEPPSVRASSIVVSRLRISMIRGQTPMVHRCIRSRAMRTLFSVRSIHTLFFVWGLVVFVCHLHAMWVSSTIDPVEMARIGCKSNARPWLVQEYSCVVLEINCARRGMDGSATDIDAALRLFNPRGIASLIITHCPRLEMPPRVQLLANMIGFEITNATLVDWSADAAFHDTTNPSLTFLSIVRTNMSTLPDGLLSRNFPLRLRDLHFSVCNLTSSDFPDDLDLIWRRPLNLYVEHALLDTVPVSFARMHIDRLSLMGNQLTSIPDELFRDNNLFRVISIARNPITQWPVSIGDLDILTTVIMDYTDILELPQWLLDEGQVRSKPKSNETMQASIYVSAGGSTYCRARGDFGLLRLPGIHVDCKTKVDEEFEAYALTFNYKTRPV